jgi:hypothetical protein
MFVGRLILFKKKVWSRLGAKIVCLIEKKDGLALG